MKISVLTPSYNSVEYIERAIQTVLHQDYDDVEHIVVDGGSTDGTVEILKKYPSLKWISEKDNGQSDAMNKAFKLSTGDIIVYLNADDFFEANVFRSVALLFEEHEDCDILVGDLYHESALTGEKRLMQFEHEYKKILLHFKYGFPFNPVAYFYKRIVQEKVGAFPENNHYAMDYWFLLEALRSHKVYKLDRVFGTFYKTGYNKTSNTNSNLNCRVVALNHIKKYDNSAYLYYKSNSILSKIIQIKYLYKKPFKRLFYNFYFSRYITLEEYNKIGFKEARRRRSILKRKVF